MADNHALFSFAIKNLTPRETDWLKNLMALDFEDERQRQEIEEMLGIPKSIRSRIEYWPDFSYSLSDLDKALWVYTEDSGNAWNAALWYDAGPINARVAYHFRDKYYTGANDVTGNPNFADRTGYLDAKVQYRYNENLTLSLEGKNLTNQAELTYSGDLARPNELAFAGRRYFASVSYKF